VTASSSSVLTERRVLGHLAVYPLVGPVEQQFAVESPPVVAAPPAAWLTTSPSLKRARDTEKDTEWQLDESLRRVDARLAVSRVRAIYVYLFQITIPVSSTVSRKTTYSITFTELSYIIPGYDDRVKKDEWS
jgi:hypothetical protein